MMSLGGRLHALIDYNNYKHLEQQKTPVEKQY